MSGEIYAIACAFLWALSSTLIKSQTHKLNVVLLGALRTLPALVLYWGVLLISGRIGEPFALPPRVWALFAGSTIVGLVVGDLMYFQSMKLIGLSRAMPISTTYPFFTLAFSLLFLDEQLDWLIVAGAALIAVGAYLLAVSRRAGAGEEESSRHGNLVGVGLAFAAAVCWATSTVMVRAGLSEVDVAVANSVRLTMLMISLVVLLFWQRDVAPVRSYGFRTLAIVFLAGIVGTGLGTFAFLAAVKHVGAARTSVLTASTPLFGLPFALLLREKLSARTLLGTAMTVVGVGLTIY